MKKIVNRWKPWFEDMETPADLGHFHGTTATRYAPKPGCWMSTEEYEEYLEAYKFAFRNRS